MDQILVEFAQKKREMWPFWARKMFKTSKILAWKH